MIPLDFPNPVKEESGFFGQERRAALAIICDLLAKDSLSVVIVGERRIGKTTMLDAVLRRVRTNAALDFLPVTIEPRGIASRDGLAQAILLAVADPIGKKLNETGLVDADHRFHLDSPAQFGAALMRLLGESASQRSCLVCIDEFDEVLRNAGDELSKVIGLVNWLVQQTARTGLPLRFILTMTHIPEALAREKASPLMSQTYQVFLNLFPPVDIEAMIKGLLSSQASLSKEGLDYLYALSGGHPYFAKLLLANMQEWIHLQGGRLVVSPETLNQAVQAAVNDPRAETAVKNLYEIQFSKDEKRIILLLAHQRKPVLDEKLREASIFLSTAAKRLVERGYLARGAAGYDFRIAFLGDWLRNWSAFDEELQQLHVERILDPFAGSRPTVVEEEDLWHYDLRDE